MAENFSIERISTISASDYALNVGKKLDDYNLIGVQYNGNGDIRDFVKIIPESAEVVVAFGAQGVESSRSCRQTDGVFTDKTYTAHGTALVPKTMADF